MANKVFNGSAFEWDTASAWTPSGIPVNGDSVLFPAGVYLLYGLPSVSVVLHDFNDVGGAYGAANFAGDSTDAVTVTGTATLNSNDYSYYSFITFTGQVYCVAGATFDTCGLNGCVIYSPGAGITANNCLIQNGAIVVFNNLASLVIGGNNTGILKETGGRVGSGSSGSANTFFDDVNANFSHIYNDAGVRFGRWLSHFTNISESYRPPPVDIAQWNGTPVTGTGPSGGSSSGPTAADIATAVAAAVLATPGNRLATDATGAVLENHGQAGAYGNPVMTVTVTLNGSANPLITWSPASGANRYIVSKTTSNGVVSIGTVTAPATLLVDTTGPVAGAKYAVTPAY